MGIGRTLWALVLSPFVSQKLLPMVSIATREDLQALKELIDAGTVVPVVEKTFVLAETPEALDQVGKRHARGKVVITM